MLPTERQTERIGPMAKTQNASAAALRIAKRRAKEAENIRLAQAESASSVSSVLERWQDIGVDGIGGLTESYLRMRLGGSRLQDTHESDDAAERMRKLTPAEQAIADRLKLSQWEALKLQDAAKAERRKTHRLPTVAVSQIMRGKVVTPTAPIILPTDKDAEQAKRTERTVFTRTNRALTFDARQVITQAAEQTADDTEYSIAGMYQDADGVWRTKR